MHLLHRFLFEFAKYMYKQSTGTSLHVHIPFTTINIYMLYNSNTDMRMITDDQLPPIFPF